MKNSNSRSCVYLALFFIAILSANPIQGRQLGSALDVVDVQMDGGQGTTQEEERTFDSFLDPMLIERVAGTKNDSIVREFIMSEMKNSGWTVETDPFESDTPLGVRSFESVIATLNPKATKKLLLVCHFSSKFMPDFTFVGATDGAVPCAMLLHLAYKWRNTPALREREDLTLRFMFMDGEEAFKKYDIWYASEHLSKVWAESGELENIEAFLWMDLIGTPNPIFLDYLNSSSSVHTELMEIEVALRRSEKWTRGPKDNDLTYFSKDQNGKEAVLAYESPFVTRGCKNVIYMIPSVFPDFWHKEGDKKQNLYYPPIKHIMLILEQFFTRRILGTST